MDSKQELNMNEMEQAVGGVNRTVNTGIADMNAAVRSGAGTGFKQIASLPNGTVVDTVSDQLFFDEKSGRNFVEIRYTDPRGKSGTGWIAASLVGLKRYHS